MYVLAFRMELFPLRLEFQMEMWIALESLSWIIIDIYINAFVPFSVLSLKLDFFCLCETTILVNKYPYKFFSQFFYRYNIFLLDTHEGPCINIFVIDLKNVSTGLGIFYLEACKACYYSVLMCYIFYHHE